MTLANAIRGQRVVIGVNELGFLDRTTQQLLRAEDDTVDVWTVVLAPVTRNQTGENIDGQPARLAGYFLGAAGNIAVVMTWGGGGVVFRTRFLYPVNGATFSVAGQNVMVEIQSLPSFVGGFTPETAPAVEGWVMPSASPATPEPLVEWTSGPFPVPIPILPWTRAVWVGKDTVGSTCTVTFSGTSIAVTVFVPVQLGVQRIAIPTGAETVIVTPSAGIASIGMEMSFT